VDWDRVNTLLENMEKLGVQQVAAGGVSPSQVTVSRGADMRYLRQGREINVPITNGKVTREHVEKIRQSFYSAYRDLYSRHLTDVPIETVSWRVAVSGPRPQVELKKLEESLQKGPALKKKRPVYFPEYKGFYRVQHMTAIGWALAPRSRVRQ
jgi:N-methylhydantoinase A